MITSEIELLKILADGKIYSGQVLAEKAGVSRAEIWKKINKIKNKNVEIKSIKGKGYCLASPIELLDDKKIRNQLSSYTNEHLQSLELLYQTESTNQLLMEQLANFPIHANVLLAEYQSEGKGRGSNKWLSGPGVGLCMSIGWHFDYIPKTFSDHDRFPPADITTNNYDYLYNDGTNYHFMNNETFESVELAKETLA